MHKIALNMERLIVSGTSGHTNINRIIIQVNEVALTAFMDNF